MKKKNDLEELEELGLTLEDCRICDEDYDTMVARMLREDASFYEQYMKGIVKEFNNTKEIGVFLLGLKKLLMANNVAAFSRQTGIGRTNLYSALNPGNNPSFATVLKITEALGIKIGFSVPAKRKAAEKHIHSVAEHTADAAHGTPASHGSGYPAGYTIQAKGSK